VVTTFSRPSIAIFLHHRDDRARVSPLPRDLERPADARCENHPRYNALRKRAAVFFAVLVAVGNISIPVCVMTGFVRTSPPDRVGEEVRHEHGAESKVPKARSRRSGRRPAFEYKLVNPSNKRKPLGHRRRLGARRRRGRGVAGRAGLHVSCFCYQDSPRRAHSIAAQGGITPPRTTRTTATA